MRPESSRTKNPGRCCATPAIASLNDPSSASTPGRSCSRASRSVPSSTFLFALTFLDAICRLQDLKQSLRQPFERALSQRVVGPRSAPLDIDEACLAQYFQVMGDCRLFDLEGLLELAHTQRVMLGEQADHLQADLVAQRVQRRGLFVDLGLIEVGAGNRGHTPIVAAPPLYRKHLGGHVPLSRNQRVSNTSKYVNIMFQKGQTPMKCWQTRDEGEPAEQLPLRSERTRWSSSRLAPAGLRCHLSPSSPAPWRQRLRRPPGPALRRQQPWTSDAPSPPAPFPSADPWSPAQAGARA